MNDINVLIILLFIMCIILDVLAFSMSKMIGKIFDKMLKKDKEMLEELKGTLRLLEDSKNK